MDNNKILETVRMLKQEHLDVRTITMGISLIDCAGDDVFEVKRKIYDKITKYSQNLVKVSNEVSDKYGVPIINKRITVTPISLVLSSDKVSDYIMIAKTLDEVAKLVGIDFIGGYSALVQKGATPSDKTLISSIPEALSQTKYVCSSVNVASTKSGINMEVIKGLGDIILEAAELTKDQNSIACAKFVVFANAVGDNPFMAGGFHGIGEGNVTINVGVSGPGAVHSALKSIKGEPFDVVSEIIKKTAFKITRMGELMAMEIADKLGVEFGTIDLSLAPTPAIGDSVARILEEMGIAHVGGHGTTAALALLNDAVKKGGIMASSRVGGLSGAFIPLSEDEGMIESARLGHLNIDKLEAMTSVCSVGLDMIAIAGDTPASTISAIIADECAIGVINNKTTAVRVIPVHGKQVGENVSFGGLLGEAPIIPVHNISSADFVKRGGIIPAPVHSFKN